MDEFKVSVESLHTTRIKEIVNDKDIYEDKPGLSQRLTELAQRLDFTGAVEGEDSEPAAKRAAQKWPWEFTHSKLKQALTESSVLLDVLQVYHQFNPHKYLALDPVAASPPQPVPPTYQYILKKKSLGVAAKILRKGTQDLSQSSSHGIDFHKALSSLRRKWRLRRTATGAIIGDLSYRSAGSLYAHAAWFEVHKGDSEEIKVVIPRELRGRSEILVYLYNKPVKDMVPLTSLQACPTDQLNKKRGHLPSWEQQLIAAQNVLFNQELFTQLAKEAYDQKPPLPYEVFTNRINIPLSMHYWLSVLHVREYEEGPISISPPSSSSSSSSSSLPAEPHWGLVVALKQLLRGVHKHRATLDPPRPATAGFSDNPQLKDAGVVPLSATEIKELAYSGTIFDKFLQKAKHVYNEERLQQWLSELCGSSSDPLLSVSWTPDRSLTSNTARLLFTEPQGSSNSRSLDITLAVEEVKVQQINDDIITLPMEKDRLMKFLRHQVVLHQMGVVEAVAREQEGWRVVQELPHAVFSQALAKSPLHYTEACNIVLLSSDAHRKIDLLLEWGRATVSSTVFATGVTSQRDVAAVGPQTETFFLATQPGANFQQRLASLLS